MSSSSHWIPPPDKICFTFLFSVFWEKKTFLFKRAIQGISLWHFHIYVYNHNWFIPSVFSPFYISPLLMVTSTGLQILYPFLYRKYINHIHLLNFLLLPSASHMWPAFIVTCFS
jgi:hypothetical protein